MRAGMKHRLSFVSNKGQEDSYVCFTAMWGAYKYFFCGDGMTILKIQHPESEFVLTKGKRRNRDTGSPDIMDLPETARAVSLKMSFVEGRPNLIPDGTMKASGIFHYFKGTDPAGWVANVPHFEDIRYRDIWSGIDLELAWAGKNLKMNWVLEQPAYVSCLKIIWAGADSLEIAPNGDLLIHHALGTIIDHAPEAYQEIDGARVPIECRYTLSNSFVVGFHLGGPLRTDLPVVIDPEFQYRTLSGGAEITSVNGIAYDTAGHAYGVGTITSPDFPVAPGMLELSLNGDNDMFITKFALDGESLIYTTYLSGAGQDQGLNLCVDEFGSAYLVGDTFSSDFPVTPGACQTAMNGPRSMTVTKLSPDGSSLVWSTLLGGTGSDAGRDIDLSDTLEVFITGEVQSDDFPVTPGCFQPTKLGALTSACACRLSADGSTLIASTYLSGPDGFQSGTGIKVTPGNDIIVAGGTDSLAFPVTPGVFQQNGTLRGSGFITKFTPDLTGLIYSTYLTGQDDGHVQIDNLALDSAGDAIVCGMTESQSFPTTANAFQSNKTGAASAFVTRINFDGSALLASTYLGGNGLETRAFGIDAGPGDIIYVTGRTEASDFPVTPGIPSTPNFIKGVFVTAFHSDLSALVFSFTIGNHIGDTGYAIAVAPNNVLYVGGSTFTPDFPVTPGAFQTDFPDDAIATGFVLVNRIIIINVSRASLRVVKAGPGEK